jgi:hypothetical protein
MKIYNAKTATVQLPLGMRRLVISGKSLSQDFMPTSQFLQMIARTFSPKDLAIIVSGAWEGNMCAETATLHEYCVSSVEEAIARFNPPEELKKEEPKEELSEPAVPETKEEPEVESNPELSEPDGKNEEKEQEKETKKAKRVRATRKVTRKKKVDEEKPAEE